jgi:hypothetical protein
LIDDPEKHAGRNGAAQKAGLRRGAHDIEARNRRLFTLAEFLRQYVPEPLHDGLPDQITGADVARRAAAARLRLWLGGWERRTTLSRPQKTVG